MSAPPDAITLALGAVPAIDPFGLDIEIDGAVAARTIAATGPGLFRTFRQAGDHLLKAGEIVGFLQRGPVLLPVLMPETGWLLATAPDGLRVEHGTPVVRILIGREEIAQ